IALQKDEIVRRVLHLQKHADRMTIRGDIVGDAAADRRIEPRRLLDVGNCNLVVVESTRLRALMFAHIHVEAWLAVHCGADLEWRAADVGRMQGAALKWAFDPLARKLMLLERVLAQLELFLIKYAQSGTLIHGRFGSALDHQAVMRALLEPTQIKSVLVAIADYEPEHLGVKL